MMRPDRELVLVVLTVGLALWALPRAISAQQDGDVDSAVEEVELELESAELGVTPGGAFLRSLVVPGWGHAATESYGRAGFYVTAQTGSLWMLWQTSARRAEAEGFERAERRIVRDRLRAAGVTDSTGLGTMVDEDPAVARWTALVEARDQQVEDWSALSIFLLVLGATDAFVAAHLADYPEPLSLNVIPVRDGAVQVGLSVPLGAPRWLR